MKTIKTLILMLLLAVSMQAQEYAMRTVTTGSADVFKTDSPVDVTVESSYARFHYQASSVPIFRDDAVTSLAFKGWNPGQEQVRHVKVTQVKGSVPYQYKVLYDGDCLIPAGGSADECIALLQLELSESVEVDDSGFEVIIESSGEVSDAPLWFEHQTAGIRSYPVATLSVRSEVAYYEGTVTDRDGHPVAGAQVRLYRPNYTTGEVDLEYSASVNDEGYYSVRAEEANCTYRCTVHAEGYPDFLVDRPFYVGSKSQLNGVFDPFDQDVVLFDRLDFTADRQATIILPETPSPSWGRYYRLSHREGRDIIFVREQEPKANVPYVIFPNQDFSIALSDYLQSELPEAGYVPFYDSADVREWGFFGTYESRDLPHIEMFARFFDCTPDCHTDNSAPLRVGAFRAYLVTTFSGMAYDELKCVFVGETTDITEAATGHTDARLFDLQGRRVQGTPQRGLYIRDGKKVLK